jgi:hypothetical protein
LFKKLIFLNSRRVGRAGHYGDICNISSAIFAVLYKRFDRHSGNNDFVFCKVVLFGAPIGGLPAEKFDDCADFCKFDPANKLGDSDEFAGFCLGKSERCRTLRKRSNKTRILKIINLFF